MVEQPPQPPQTPQAQAQAQTPIPDHLTASEHTALADLVKSLLHAASRADVVCQHTQRGYQTRTYKMQAAVLRGFANTARKHLDTTP